MAAKPPAAETVLQADPHLPRQAESTSSSAAARTEVQVAVGVLLLPDQRFLLTTRPLGKAYAGYWEFPGGKLEAGESVAQALARELNEELGLLVDPSHVQAWRQQVVDYPHALVRLHFCQLRRWQGEPHMREGQRACWCTLPVTVGPILPGALPVLAWLGEGGMGSL